MSETRYFPEEVEEYFEEDLLLQDEGDFLWADYSKRKQGLKDNGYGEITARYNAARGAIFFDTPVGYPLQKFMERQENRIDRYEEEELEKVKRRGKIGTVTTMALMYGGVGYGALNEFSPELWAGLGAVMYLHLRSEVEWGYTRQLLEEEQ